MKCLFYKSESFNPYENLAVEEYLFDNLGQDFFVFYLWQNKNTVVIGRNQNAYLECKVDLLLKNSGHLAKRMTGGGAVYHDLGNLNFTFIFNKNNYNTEKNFSAIVKALKTFNINAEISGRNDLTVDGRKISGNAFMNADNKTCHHGTLLVNVDLDNMTKYLNVSQDKLLKNGVHSVKSRVANLNEFCDYLTIDNLEKALTEAVEDVFKPKQIIFADIKGIDDRIQKFASEKHIYGSNARFISRASERFSWGKSDIDFTVQSGKISNIEICTDSLEVEEFEKIKQCLQNRKINEIENIFDNTNIIGQDIISLIKRSL